MALDDKLLKDIDFHVGRSKPSTLRHFDPSPYRRKVPAAIDYVWRKFGVSNWANGSVQIIDPATYAGVVEDLLEDNEFIKAEDVTPYFISAFGKIALWHRKYQDIYVNSAKSRIVFMQKPIVEAEYREEVAAISSLPDEVSSHDDWELFDAALAKFGPIGEGQIYGFVPALVLGGSPVIENVRKLDGPVHLSILSQMSPFATYYFDATEYPGRLVPME